MSGYQRLTTGDDYNTSQGYGWQGDRPTHMEFRRPVRTLKLRELFGQWLLEEAYDNYRKAMTRTACSQDIGFRLYVPTVSTV